MTTPAHVRLDGVDLHGTLAASGDTLTLTTSAEDWPGYAVGRRVQLHRGRGPEWVAIDGVVVLAGLAVVRLVPAERPPTAPPYRPPVGKGNAW